ncbi:MAG: HEAT repeat domain-containing protein [Treponema bryantii]|nr:HEAT repeat domain-containing protein [Treponema bryantii]
MKLTRKVVISLLMLVYAGSVFAQQQNVNKKQNNEEETSVETEYLNDVDGDIITTLADSDEYDNKLVALQYLQAALDDGNTSEAVIYGLDKLAGEGINNQSRTNGRLINNFPEIRRQACLLMAKVPTEHSKNTLISIAVADNEPMVIAAACKALGEIGINDNDETVEAIAFANRRNQVLNPTSSLALEVLNSFEALADSTENKKTMIDAIARISTDYRYVTPVRQKAYKLLKKLSSSNSDDSKNKKNKSDVVEVEK